MPQIHPKRFSWDRYAGLAIMLTLHVAVLYGLWSYRLIPTPQETVTLFVNFINPPAPPKVEEPPKPPPPRPKPPPPRPIPEPPRQIVSTAPVEQPSEPVAPPPPPEPVVEPPPEPVPDEPVVLANELSVVCPERPAPAYPLASRRLGEQGQVVLRVELDENGRISSAQVETSSGSARLDEAALNAVRRWRCSAASHGGVPARAIALQPFNFRLQ